MIWNDPFSYDLEVLTIVNNEGTAFDIRKIFLGLKLHESINQNFLSGEISILDGTGFLENAKLFGQETLHLRFSSPHGIDPSAPKPEGHEIDKLFRIYHVGEVQRVNQDSLLYNLRFCSPELIQSKRIRVSQAFKGGLIKIGATLVGDHLGIEPPKDKFNPKKEGFLENISTSKKENIHVVIPNWTVNYAVNWLCKRAQGADDKDPIHDRFYFYETANGGFRFDNISRMLDVDAFKEKEDSLTFIYTAPGLEPANVEMSWDHMGKDESGGRTGFIGMGRRIQAYEIGSIANVLEGTVNGFFASKQITVDPIEQVQEERSYNYHQKFFGSGVSAEDFPLIRQEAEVLHTAEAVEGDDPDKGAEPVSVPVFKEKPISSYKDAHVILTSKTPYAYDKENKTLGLDADSDQGKLMYQQAADQLLEYYTLNLVLPARTNITVGTMIKIEIPPAKAGEESITENDFHTGRHLITNIEWELSLSQCKVKLTCIKDSFNNRIETATVKYPPTIKQVEQGDS